jgi:tetratricopeptide (TPR) repeat protein
MKKRLAALILAGAAALALHAQNPAAADAAVPARYELIPGTGDSAAVFPAAGNDEEILRRELERRFDIYNRLFRFDPARTALPLRVRFFRDQAAYDGYVSARLGLSREGAVYLHYNQRERRELVVHLGSPGAARMIPSQAFLQYFRAFVPSPPAWMKEGFAVYFATLTAGEGGELSYEENTAWLETVKRLEGIDLEGVLMADLGEPPPQFQALSWSLVSFLLNSGSEDYFRSLTDSFMLLSPAAGAAENAAAVRNRLYLLASPAAVAEDYRAYLASRKTFAGLIEAGQGSYAAGDPQTAESFFLEALEQKPRHHAPYYYLGLLAYEKQRYDQAEQYYLSALRYGADAALVRYALGLSAAAAGKKSEAAAFLEAAATAAPERYRDRVQELLKRLR